MDCLDPRTLEGEQEAGGEDQSVGGEPESEQGSRAKRCDNEQACFIVGA
jgi:hypothetical protein